MRIMALVEPADGSSRAWIEEFEKPTDDAWKTAEEIVAKFNATLRPWERSRRLIGICILSTKNLRAHQWIKMSLVTQQGRGGSLYDAYQCKLCGITGKRFGLAEYVTPDPKFKSRRFQHCQIVLREGKP